MNIVEEELMNNLPVVTLPKTPAIDIEFQDLSYSVRNYSTKSGWKPILKGVSGRFQSGELSAILGPSGAGKSTLLNILAGYVCQGVTGTININDSPCDMQQFSKCSNYIMQEDLLQQKLSVKESMLIASRLKVGNPILNTAARLSAIRDILIALGLESCQDTWSEYLSGGQRKRLSVALELVSNPTVIFLDEPTTGLDSFCLKQVVNALKTLTGQGRTVICTVHQPSASEFKLFEQVYFMADGYCVYNGSPSNMVGYFSSLDMPCPTTHFPADYLVELVHMNNDNASMLSAAICNGRINKRRPKDTQNLPITINEHSDCLKVLTAPASCCTQFRILLFRMLLQRWRSASVLRLQLIHHVVSGVLLGGLFFGMGSDAAMAIPIFKFCISILVFFVYTYALAPVLTFPYEVKLLKREYFNHWYELKAYYAALTVSSLPGMIANSFVFICITYFMTNQPMSVYRFFCFSVISILMGLCSEGYGMAVGSVFSITNGCLVGPATMAPMVALAIYGIGYGPVIEPFMDFLMKFTFVRYGIVGLVKTIYGLDRTLLNCGDELYCHYKDPSLLLRDLGMLDQPFVMQFLGILVFTLFYRFLAYMGLRYRLTSEFSHRLVDYAKKILRQKR